MRKGILAGAWLAAGVPIGASLFAWFSAHNMLTLEHTVKVIDLAQLGATIFLALYIPLALETYRDRRKYAQEMLIEHVRSLVSGLQAVNDYLRENIAVDPSQDPQCLRIRAGFTTANLKIAGLQKRLPIDCGDQCIDPLRKFRRAYDRYYETVTGGSLYGDGIVTMRLFRRQEFAFVTLRDAEIDLIRFVSDHGLR